MTRDPEDDPPPRIGRGRLRPKFPLAQVVQIMMLVTALIAVLVMREGCGQGVANWFGIVAPDPARSAASDAGR
jgi:hypothetical protein